MDGAQPIWVRVKYENELKFLNLSEGEQNLESFSKKCKCCKKYSLLNVVYKII